MPVSDDCSGIHAGHMVITLGCGGICTVYSTLT